MSYTGNKGGTDVYTRNLYLKLATFEFEFELHALASKEALNLDMSWFPGSITYSRFSGDSKIQWALAEIFSLMPVIRKKNPFLIHSPANFGPVFTKVPVILTIHDALYWTHPQLSPNRMLVPGVRLLQKLASRNAWKIVTDSNASKTELIKSLHISPDKIIVIYLGGSNDTLREDINLKNNSYFLAGGNRFKHKNWEGLLKAFDLLNSTVRPKLMITGGRSPDPLIEMIKRYELQDYIQSIKWVPEFEKEKLYLNARAVIVPSFVEGFSLPVVQAMKDGVSLIISDIPVHREIAEDAACYFNPESPKSIADAIIEIMNNPKDTNARIKLGLVRGRNFTWEKCAKAVLTLINEASLLSKK